MLYLMKNDTAAEQLTPYILCHKYCETWICCYKEQVFRMKTLLKASMEGYGESRAWYFKKRKETKSPKQPTDDACDSCSLCLHSDWNSLVVLETGHWAVTPSKVTWSPLKSLICDCAFPPETLPLVPILSAFGVTLLYP